MDQQTNKTPIKLFIWIENLLSFVGFLSADLKIVFMWWLVATFNHFVSPTSRCPQRSRHLMHISADFHSCKATEAVATCWRAPFTGAGTSFFAEDQRHLESNKHTVVFVGDFVVIKLRNYKSYRDLQLQPFNHDAKGRDWHITLAMAQSFFVLFVVKSRLSRLNHAWLGKASCMKVLWDGRHISIDCNCPRATGLERFRWYGGIIEASPQVPWIFNWLWVGPPEMETEAYNLQLINIPNWMVKTFIWYPHFQARSSGSFCTFVKWINLKPTLMDSLFVGPTSDILSYHSAEARSPYPCSQPAWKRHVVTWWLTVGKKEKPMLNPVQLPLDDKLEL